MNFVLILCLCGKGIEVVPVLEGLFCRNLTLPRYAAVIRSAAVWSPETAGDRSTAARTEFAENFSDLRSLILPMKTRPLFR